VKHNLASAASRSTEGVNCNLEVRQEARRKVPGEQQGALFMSPPCPVLQAPSLGVHLVFVVASEA